MVFAKVSVPLGYDIVVSAYALELRRHMHLMCQNLHLYNNSKY